MNIKITNLKTGHATAISTDGQNYAYDPEQFNLSREIHLDPKETITVFWINDAGIVDYEFPIELKRKDLQPTFRSIKNVILNRRPLSDVVFVRVHLSDNTDWKPYVYKWFTRRDVSNFTRDTETSSGDTTVHNAHEFSYACGIEIAEDYLKASWNTVRKIIETSINEFRVDKLTIPFSLYKRFDRSMVDALQDVWEEIVNGGNTEKIKQYLSVIITQLKYPNAKIIEQMGDFESSYIAAFRTKIVREIGNNIDDNGETFRLFEIVSEALDQWYTEPHY